MKITREILHPENTLITQYYTSLTFDLPVNRFFQQHSDGIETDIDELVTRVESGKSQKDADYKMREDLTKVIVLLQKARDILADDKVKEARDVLAEDMKND